MGAARSPSIRDVAVAAGVSHQTVSRVLNGRTGIRPDTERRVRLAIDDLGWHPNRAARSLATSRHATIGLLTTARSLYGSLRSSIGLEEAAREGGYGFTSASSDAGPGGIAAALAGLVGHGVDGLVLYTPQRAARDAVADLAVPVPSVSLFGTSAGRRVAFDQVRGAEHAVEHLAGLGHRRIALLPGPAGWSEAEQRQEGYRAGLARHGLPAVVLPAGDWSSDSGYAIGRAVLPAADFTAVLAANDEMATGLLHAAHEVGVAVPGDLSVVGFDDVPEARHLIPPLTTVRQDFVELGRRAVRTLIDEIEGAGHVGDVRLDLSLAVRRSTGAVPRPARP